MTSRLLVIITLSIGVDGCHRDLTISCDEYPQAPQCTGIQAETAPLDGAPDDDRADVADAVVGDTTVEPDTEHDDAAGPDSAADSVLSSDSGESPDVDAGPLVCATGEKRCTGATLLRCNATRTGFETVAACATPELCMASDAVGCASPVCAAGSTRCVGAVIEQCNAGRTAYVATSTCATTELCAASSGTTCAAPACNVGEKRCSGNVAQACNAGRTGWANVETCLAPQTCGGGGVAGACGGCSGGPLPGPTMIDVGGYCIDATEVTQRHYQDFLTAKSGDTSGQPGSCGWNSSYVPAGTSLTGCSSYTLTATSTPSLPVTCVDWCDAFAYCKWAGKRLCGRIGGGANPPASRIDPASSQWFRACSNAGTRAYPYSSTYNTYSCRTESSDFINVGGLFQCKGAGAWANVFDMSGNALEWEDSCDGSLSDSKCEARGGYFASDASGSTCAAAVAPARNFSLRGLGFRCCGP